MSLLSHVSTEQYHNSDQVKYRFALLKTNWLLVTFQFTVLIQQHSMLYNSAGTAELHENIPSVLG